MIEVRAHPRKGTRGVRRYRQARIRVGLTPRSWKEIRADKETVAYTDPDNPGIVFINYIRPSEDLRFQRNASGIFSHETIHDTLDRMGESKASVQLDRMYGNRTLMRNGLWPRQT